MKNDHPDLTATIAALARSAAPVRPLEPPAVRLARWAALSTALALAAVLVLHVRADAGVQLANGWFVARAGATLAIAAGAAAVAFATSVPGAAPPLGLRLMPLWGCVAWAAMLGVAAGGLLPPLDLLLHGSRHPACVLTIIATAAGPGIALVRMLRRAAPLQPRWTGGMATLASLAIGALGAQFVCANDGAAHQLCWHVAPVAVLVSVSVCFAPTLLGDAFARQARAAASSAGGPSRLRNSMLP